jgi:hypothetical protein
MILAILLVHPPKSRVARAVKSPWWRDLVLYAVYVRGFYDSDGDGLGDLRGLASYIRDLGVGALWLLSTTHAAGPLVPPMAPAHDRGCTGAGRRVDGTPLDLIGGARFPSIEGLTYLLTLGPRSLHWLRLEDG